MANVTFDEETSTQPRVQRSSEPRGLYKLVVKLGLAKDEQQANIALIVIALLAIAVAIIYPMLVL